MFRNTIFDVRFTLIFVLVMSFFSSLPARRILVSRDGFGDVMSIQEGINMAADTDTVLVSSGIWNGDLTIQNKTITLASLYLLDRNPAHISNTIIDGRELSGGLRIYFSGSSNSPVKVIGFSVRNGRSNWSYTSSLHYDGGGICVLQSHVEVSHCDIYDNQASRGGGIASMYSTLLLKGNRIHHNHATRSGGGLTGVYAGTLIIFDETELNSIYMNTSAGGMDISYGATCTYTTINLDKGSVSNNDPYFYALRNNEQLNIAQAAIEQVDYDLWVSPDGDNDNDGRSPLSPLKTAIYALAILQPRDGQTRTINLLPGIYSRSSNDERLPLRPKTRVNIIGAEMQTVIMDGENNCAFIQAMYAPDYLTVKNITMINGLSLFGALFWFTDYTDSLANSVNIENIHIRDSWCSASGFQVSSYRSMTISNLTVEDSKMGIGVTLDIVESVNLTNFKVQRLRPTHCDDVRNYCAPVGIIKSAVYANYNSVVNISNFLITDNYDGSDPHSRAVSGLGIVGGGGSNIVNITNCTIANNSSRATSAALNLGLANSVINISNTIVAGNSPLEVAMTLDNSFPGETMRANIRNSLILGGHSSVQVLSPRISVFWLEGNKEENPRFSMEEPLPYQLLQNSPCVDTGTTDVVALNLPHFDLAYNHRIWNRRIDMGCYEYGSNPYVNIEDQSVTPIDDDISITVFPNPFNPKTNISYVLPLPGFVRLSIYNVKGQKVRSLFGDWQESGSHSIVWDGKDNKGSAVGSGIFYACLEYSGRQSMRKLMLLK